VTTYSAVVVAHWARWASISRVRFWIALGVGSQPGGRCDHSAEREARSRAWPVIAAFGCLAAVRCARSTSPGRHDRLRDLGAQPTRAEQHDGAGVVSEGMSHRKDSVFECAFFLDTYAIVCRETLERHRRTRADPMRSTAPIAHPHII